LKPEKSTIGTGVEAQAGDPLHGEREQLEAAFAAAAVGPAVRERTVDLLAAAALEVGLREGRDLHVRVARDREQVGALPVLRDVQDHDRVGPDQVVAGGALVDADHQDVQRALERLAALGRAGVARAGAPCRRRWWPRTAAPFRRRSPRR
jgi:hypothetical protein